MVFYMLANRLKVLLAERQLTNKQVSDDTKISRNTISNIINNPDANIATNTIDRLCNYLEIDPSNFFEYSPYLITFEYKVGIYDEYDSDPKIAPFALLHVVSGDTEDSFRFIYEPDDYLNSNIATRDYDGFDEIYSCLPLSFKSDIMDILVGGAKKFVIDKSIKLDHEYKSGDTLKLLIRDIGKSYHYKYFTI